MDNIGELIKQLVILDIQKQLIMEGSGNCAKPKTYYLVDKSIDEKHYLLYEMRTGLLVPALDRDHTREFQSEFTDEQLIRIGLSMDGLDKIEINK